MKKYVFIVLCVLANCGICFGFAADNNLLDLYPEETSVSTTVNIISYNQGSLEEYKRLAILHADNNDVENAVIYIEKYIKEDLEVGFLDNDRFKKLRNSEAFINLAKKYRLNFSELNLFYLFSALIGMFIGIILLVKRSHRKSANLLISAFVLIHSIFILHIFLYQSNLKFQYPHILFMSTIFSFLYGPLIYFYFKQGIQDHKFKIIDSLHLLPSVVIILILLPVFALPSIEKLKIMFDVGVIDTRPYLISIFTAKLMSLLIYVYLVLRIYFKRIKKNKKVALEVFKWKRNLARLGVAYIVFYAIYGLIIIKVIPRFDFLYHLQVVAMAGMVLYIGFTAYLKPNLFSSDFIGKPINKYKKSGLTPSYSEELKRKLVHLMDVEKVYRQSDISLEKLSQRMETTRHNTSQVINEHFDLNFFELINKYRISEASEILKGDTHKNLNIIEVAYEVGFNNKVTFNKSFKKYLSQTPSQYIHSLQS